MLFIQNFCLKYFFLETKQQNKVGPDKACKWIDFYTLKQFFFKLVTYLIDFLQ